MQQDIMRCEKMVLSYLLAYLYIHMKQQLGLFQELSRKAVGKDKTPPRTHITFTRDPGTHSNPLSYPEHYLLRAIAPFRLAPIRRSAEIRSCAAKIASATAQPTRAFRVHDRSARIAHVRRFGGS